MSFARRHPDPERGGPAPTDAELVARVRAGERECYSTLVRRHQDALYRHARGMGLDHDAALDVAQDALVKAYTAIEVCRDPSRFRAWILRIVRNRCLDYLRDIRRSHVPLDLQPEGDVALAVIPAGEDDLRETLAGALDALPPLLRDAFLLKHLAGYAYDEMADIAGVTPSAMKMRVHRAREALRARLLEEDGLPM